MEYKHISDCWSAIKSAKTRAEVEKLFLDFPRWSGDWEIKVDFDNTDSKYVVYNYYYEYESLQTNYETLDIPVEEDDLLDFQD